MHVASLHGRGRVHRSMLHPKIKERGVCGRSEDWSVGIIGIIQDLNHLQKITVVIKSQKCLFII